MSKKLVDNSKKLALELIKHDEEFQRKVFYEFWTKYEAKIKLNTQNENIFYFTNYY